MERVAKAIVASAVMVTGAVLLQPGEPNEWVDLPTVPHGIHAVAKNAAYMAGFTDLCLQMDGVMLDDSRCKVTP